jgi:hypothetical protein
MLRLAERRVSILIGKLFSCREKLYRFESDLTRDVPEIIIFINKYYDNCKGRVAIGKVRYLLNIVF